MNMNIRRLLSSHKIITITGVVLGLLIILLPVAVKHTAVHLLKKAGAKNITLQDVDLNLFTGDIKIEGFSTMADEDEKVSLAALDLNLSMLNLFKARIFIESLTIDGLHIAIEQKPDSLSVGIPIPMGQDTAETEKIEPVSEKDTEEQLLDFGIGELRFTNSSIAFHNSEVSAHVKINHINLKNLLSWEPATAASVDIDALINDSPFNAAISLNAFSDQKQVGAEIKLNEFSLEPYAVLADKVIAKAKGFLTIDTRLSLSNSRTPHKGA